MQQQLQKREQMQTAMQMLYIEMNDYFTEQERRISLVYSGLREHLQNLERAVVASNGAVNNNNSINNINNSIHNIANSIHNINNNNAVVLSDLGMMNSPNYLGVGGSGIEHKTPIYTRYVVDHNNNNNNNTRGVIGGTRVTVPSTPPSERMPFAPSQDSRGIRGESSPQQERREWGVLTASSRHEVTPAISPHNKTWVEDDISVRLERNSSVDYTCFDAFDKLVEDNEITNGNTGGAIISPYIYDDDMRQEQQLQGLSSYTNINNNTNNNNINSDNIPICSPSSLQNQHITTSVKISYVNGRPKAVPIPDGTPDEPEKLGIDIHARCKVLVEFKRKRVLQFESKEYVSPGSYVMVGGDRGEDLGLVTYTWCETIKPNAGDTSMEVTNGNKSSNPVLGVSLAGSTLPRDIGLGTGTVLRLAEEHDISQLHSVQVELERRAMDVCSQRVLERGLPMTIVDAEYQFDKNKLTFFYEARQRTDFRDLVRDLYKTFRARIWMEIVEN